MASSAGYTVSAGTPVNSAAYDGTTNRLAGVVYDGAGNETGLSPYTLGYDAENRMTAASSAVNGNAAYGYDADRKRVTRTAGGQTSLYVYDSGGQLAAEYGTLANVAAGVQYYTADQLGSTRMVTDGGGAVVGRYDCLPFGEAIGSGFNGRSGKFSVGAYPGDGVGVKFTGKERDSETGLDYFGARYMSSAQGRFTSPDPKQFSMRTIANPQKWNKYAYTLNNPLALIDPDGREEVTVTYRAFIPSSTANVLGFFSFRGDDRPFSTRADAPSRIAVSVRVESDPSIRSNPLLEAPRVTIGQTERFSPFPKVETATEGLPTANVSRDGNGNVVIKIGANTKNPLFPLPEPGINPNLTVMIPPDGSSASVTGQTSAFPAQEVNGSVGNATNPLFRYAPTSTSPMDLFKTVNVNQQRVPLPQCTTGSDGANKCH